MDEIAFPSRPAARGRRLSGTKLEYYRRPVILLFLVFAFGLRTWQLDGQALRGDEAATVFYSAMPISELWELSRITDPHPPLYYLLLHPWQWGVGRSAWTMRFAGVMASVLAVAALYGLSRRTLRATSIALLAAGLLAVNPLQIWLAQDVRSYPFFTLLGLLSAAALWQALKIRGPVSEAALGRPPRPSNGGRERKSSPLWGGRGAASPPAPPALRLLPWLLYILLTVACFYVHYYTVFLMAFEGLFVLLHMKKFWASKWLWLASQAVIGLSIVPGLQLASNFIGEAAGGIDAIPTSHLLRLASTALLTGFTISGNWGLWLSLLLAPVWLTGLATLLRRDRLSGSFWTLFWAVPVLGVLALSIDRPFFKERFLIQAQPAFEVLLASGFLALAGVGYRVSGKGLTAPPTSYWRRLPGGRFTLVALPLLSLALLIGLLITNSYALSNYFTDPAYAKAPPWHFYREYVRDHARPGDVMLTNFPEAAVSYYSPEGLPFYVVPDERDLPAESRINSTREIAGAYRRVWFLPMLRQGFDEQGDVLNWLDRHGDRVNQVFFPAYNLNLYLTPPTVEFMMAPQTAVFANGVRLRGYQILDKAGDSLLVPAASAGADFILAIEPEETFTLSLYWQADGPMAVPYTVFTHLVADDGFVRASWDNQPVWGTYPTTAWQPGEPVTDKYTLTVPAGSPAGDHELRVGWYNANTQERVPTLNDQGQPEGDHTILSVKIRVE